MQATKMSCSPRFFRSVRHESQNLAPSLSAKPQPQQFLVTLQIHANCHVNRVLRDPAVGAADMHHQPVEIDDRPDRLERPRPPGATSASRSAVISEISVAETSTPYSSCTIS